jgi:hypothetical protein
MKPLLRREMQRTLPHVTERGRIGQAGRVGFGAVAVAIAVLAGVLAVRAGSAPELSCEKSKFSTTSFTADSSEKGAPSLSEAMGQIHPEEAFDPAYTEAYLDPAAQEEATSLGHAFVEETRAVNEASVESPREFHVLVPVEGRYRIEAWITQDAADSFRLTRATVCW